MKIDSKNYAICFVCVCVCAKTSALLLQSISIKMGKKKKTWGKNHRNNGKQSEIHTEKSIENKSIY